MFIILDDDIIEPIILDKLTEMEVFAIEQIANANIKGIHIVLASNKLLTLLSEMDKLSLSQRGAFKNIYSKSMSLQQFRNLPFKVHVNYDLRYNVESKQNDNNGLTYCVKLSHLYSINLTQKVNFITESRKDYDFYINLATYVNKNILSYSDININLARLPGGGYDTGYTLENGIIDKTICLVIGDSDKKEKSGELGNTFQKVLDIEKKILEDKNSVFFARHLEVREKENLIPPSIYQEMSNSYDYESVLMQYDNFYKDDILREAYYFWDVKDGVTLGNFLISIDSLKKDNGISFDEPQILSYLNRQTYEGLSEDDIILKGIGPLIDKVSTEFFSNCFEEKLNDLQIKKNTFGIPESSLEKLEKKIEVRNNMHSCLCPLLNDEWITLTHLINSFGCSPSGLFS